MCRAVAGGREERGEWLKAMSIDGRLRVTGATQFVLDREYPAMLNAAGVRCPHARARIIVINTDEALELPGVHSIITGHDALNKSAAANFRFGDAVLDQPLL